MQISFSPIRCDHVLSVSRAGDIITINGDEFDFSSLPDGATVPAGTVPCEWIVGPVERIDGEVHLTLIVPHGPNPSKAVAFPAAISNPTDGPIAIPHDPAILEVQDAVEG